MNVEDVGQKEIEVRATLFPWPHCKMAGICLILTMALSQATAMDVFETQRQISQTAAGDMRPDDAICSFASVGEPLTLQEAVERALCNNSQTRQAWVRVKVQAAEVGISKAAYLPTVAVSAQGVHDESGVRVAAHPGLSSSTRTNVLTPSVSLSWVLYDFGGRDAGLRNATELLAAAQANHEATLQTVFAAVTKDFYAAQGAQGAMEASVEIERSAKGSFEAASARVNKGVAPVSDALQAQTAFAQATFNRAKAQGDWQVALGVLASDMNLRPDSGLRLPAVEDGVKPDTSYNASVSELITQAEHDHPSMREAVAQLRAAEAKVEQTQADGSPSISFAAKSSRNNQPVSPSLGQPQYPATGRDWSVAVQINIPLFEGFARSYQVQQARAQAELQQVAIDQTRDQVGLNVWTSYQALQTATQNVANSAQLLELALAAQQASQDRYLAGVGNILELLNSQSTLATAKHQRLQALTDWRAARLQLASRLGKLGMWSLN